MQIEQILKLIDGKIINDVIDLTREVKGGFGADLMSDVLTSIQPEAVLLTGLCNPQIIRTAQMADISAIVLVRGKAAPGETIALANQENIPLITTSLGMYDVCGLLYAAGLPGCEKSVQYEE